MRIEQQRFRYPRAAAIIEEMLDEGVIRLATAESLSDGSLEWIDSGRINRRDAVAVLMARQRMFERVIR